MNEKGQEFAAFRLLVDVILVFLILIIILIILQGVESLRWTISEQKLYDGFDKAVASPNGDVVLEKGIILGSGTVYSAGTFARPTVARECIEFDALGVSALQVNSDRDKITITANYTSDVYYQCLKDYSSDECDMRCIISFGKELN